MAFECDDRLVNGIPTADYFRVRLDLVGVDGTPRKGSPEVEPILRRLQGAEPYRNLMGDEAIAWLRFVRRACHAALQADRFQSPRQQARVDDLRRTLDQRIAHLAECLYANGQPGLTPAPTRTSQANEMLLWLRSGTKLGYSLWRASVLTWAREDGSTT